MDQVLLQYRTTALAAALSLIVLACDPSSPSSSNDPVPPQTMQSEGGEQSPSLVEPHRYLRLTDLAAAIRQAGHSCERVRTYSSVKQTGEERGIYKVDCLEYSYRLIVTNGQSRIERWTG